MKKATCTILLCLVALAACRRSDDELPPPYQTVHLNYSIEDGLWSYADEDYYFVISDSTTFDDSTGTLIVTTPYPLDPAYCEIVGTNCPSPINEVAWSIGQLPAGRWQLVIRLPAATVACIQNQVLWDDDYWSFDFRIRAAPP